MLKVSLTQSECWLGRAGAPCQRVQTQRSGGSPVRRRGALLVSVRFLSQSTTRTDRQTSTQTHTHGVSVCQTCVGIIRWPEMCPMFHTLSSGKTRSEQRPRPSAVTRRTHTQRLDVSTQPHSCSWLLRAHCSLHTAAAHAHFDSGFCLRVGSPNFYCSARNKPTGPNTRPVPSQKPPPTPLHREPGRHSLTGDDWHWTNTHRYVQVFSTARFISTGVTCWISSTSPPLQITLNKQLNLRSTSAASAPSGHFPSRFSMDKTRNFCN